LCRPGRRNLTRWYSVDLLPPSLLLVRAGALPPLPPLVLDVSTVAFDSGKLRFFSSLAALQDPQAFSRHLDPVRNVKWVVYAKPPFAGPQQVVDYVGRYTHRVAISNHRIVGIEDGQVKFKWLDYRDRRVPPETPAPCSAERVPPHSLLWVPRQSPPQAEVETLPRTSSHGSSE
jgi:hypothetical protein